MKNILNRLINHEIMGAKVSGLQFHGESGTETADRAESGAAVQGAGSGTDAPDERGQH